MLSAAFWLLAGAVALGIVLAARVMGGSLLLARRAAPVAHVHGALGLAGVVLLVVARPTLSPAAASLGASAMILLAGALLVGVSILIAHLRRRGASDLAIGVHATLGVGGFVILAAAYGLV